MSIQEIYSSIKRPFLVQDIALFLLILSTSVGSFWLGRQSIAEEAQKLPQVTSVVEIDNSALPALAPEAPEVIAGKTPQENVIAPSSATEGAYVASKNGTKYHLPWCAGAKSIKEENKVWFASKAEAEAAGYSPAANCKGI